MIPLVHLDNATMGPPPAGVPRGTLCGQFYGDGFDGPVVTHVDSLADVTCSECLALLKETSK